MIGLAQRFGHRGVSIVLALLAIGVAAPASAAMRHVRQWGTDSPTCGTTAAPCRSIGKAVSLALSGDTVLVGPGQYSNDLDGDANYDESGEEPSAGISIGSSVTVKSTHGASATRLEYRGTGPGYVIMGGFNAVLGKRNHGFTIISTASGTYSNVTCLSCGVSGNVIFTGNSSFGIEAYGGGSVVRDNRLASLTPGALVYGIHFYSDVIVERNVVIGAVIGFWEEPGLVLEPKALRRNVALENGKGFLLESTISAFTSNIVVANSGQGVILSPGAFITGPFKNNTFVGNDPATNCGLANQSGNPLTATKNFWGAATGPGADPADNVCNSVGSTTTTTPFLTAPVAPGPGAIQ